MTRAEALEIASKVVYRLTIVWKRDNQHYELFDFDGKMLKTFKTQRAAKVNLNALYAALTEEQMTIIADYRKQHDSRHNSFHAQHAK